MSHGPNTPDDAGKFAMPDGTVVVWKNRYRGHGDLDPRRLLAHPLNAHVHPENQQRVMTGALEEIGWLDSIKVAVQPWPADQPPRAGDPLVVFLDPAWWRLGRIFNGHMRTLLALQSQQATVPVDFYELTDQEALYALFTYDTIGAQAYMDGAKLGGLIEQVKTDNANVQALVASIATGAGLPTPYPLSTGGDLGAFLNPPVINLPEGADDPGPPPATPEEARRTLAERFGVPPFSVLDARQGYWQRRKHAWIALGIRGELGRGETLTWGGAEEVTGEHLNYYRNRSKPANPPGGDGGGLKIDEYRRAGRDPSPGGSPRPAARLGRDGKTRRGDGRGKEFGRVFGQDLMRGEHTVGAGGHGANPPVDVGNGGLADQLAHRRQRNLTWVKGDRDPATLDDTSRRILAGGGRHGAFAPPEGSAYPYPVEMLQAAAGTSIFDPVLCELVYRWFCPRGGRVLDPFAGGSVRGVVAALLGHPYTGIDLRAEQVFANELQWSLIGKHPLAATEDALPPPAWICGDGRDVATLAGGDPFDTIFTCPPYADLEIYSEDPRDLSTMDYPDFLRVYREILAASVARLAADRFAVIVVGDVRDKKGYYRNFVSDTIAAFQATGMRLYNEAILITAIGSLPIRVGKQFGAYRKLGKTHQQCLVFYNGDPARIKEYGEVEMGDPLAGGADIGEAADDG